MGKNLQRPFRSRSVVKNKRGSVFLIAAWSICLLTAFAIYASQGVRQKIMLVQRLEERDKLHYIAESGVQKGVMVLLNADNDRTYNALKDEWSNNPGALGAIKCGDGFFTVGYNCEVDSEGLQKFMYGLIDEERKINVNTTELEPLKRLCMITLGLDEERAEELAASIIDWRDEDSFLSIPLGSAEDSYYRGLRYSYESKDSGYQTMDEMLLVKGMTEERFRFLKEYVTIFGGGMININTVSPEVLMAIGIAEDTVKKILMFRMGEDGVIATSDDNVFEQTNQIVSKLSRYFPLSESEVTNLTNIQNSYLGTKSNVFTIRSVARLQNRNDTQEVTAVVASDGKILSWREL